MRKIYRQRKGYLWVSREEERLIDELIKTSGIFKNIPALRSMADFVRIATIVLGKLLKKSPLELPNKTNDEAELIDLLVKHFQR